MVGLSSKTELSRAGVDERVHKIEVALKDQNHNISLKLTESARRLENISAFMTETSQHRVQTDERLKYFGEKLARL